MGDYNRSLFFNAVRSNPFGGTLNQKQVDGMEGLLRYADHLDWHPENPDIQYFLYWLAYLLATAFHETARTMQAITEYGSQAYLDSRRYAPYYGRGFVQLTWADNYRRSDTEINRDRLVSDETFAEFNGTINQLGTPAQALHPEIAACNLFVGCHRGWYGHKLTRHITNEKRDYKNARRCVNILDKAEQIAGYARSFETALLASWQSEVVDVPDPELPPPMPEPGPELPPEPELPPDGHPYWENFPDEVIQAFRETSCDAIQVQDNQLTVTYKNPWRS